MPLPGRAFLLPFLNGPVLPDRGRGIRLERDWLHRLLLFVLLLLPESRAVGSGRGTTGGQAHDAIGDGIGFPLISVPGLAHFEFRLNDTLHKTIAVSAL